VARTQQAQKHESRKTKMTSYKDPEAGEAAMPEMEDSKTNSKAQQITRRRFILGVIAGGALVGAASYKILSPGGRAHSAGERLITLNVNGTMRRVEVMKQETMCRTIAARC
jgi:hypothetical protein